nr:hypothetical protein [Tanacetum cinerariifolium]
MDNNPYVDFLILEPSSEESSSQVVIPNNVHSSNQPPEHINKRTKDYPIDNVIGDPSRPSYKEALIESCWFKAKQEELNEFELLKCGSWDIVHEEGIDFEESFALVARLKAICIFITLGIHMNMIIYRMDVKTAFLNGIMHEKKFSKGTVDPTLFIKREGKDILLAKPTEKHLHTVKRIFRYLKGIVNMGLWYLKDSCIALTAFADADYAGCQDTRK